MKRGLFTYDHQAFRATVRASYAEQLVPEYADWERANARVSRIYGGSGEVMKVIIARSLGL
ncbi:hypothetical protein ACKUT9_23110 [Mycobacterium seoulense]|uniref:hypothetical protein n=1 Tax=Mycobacterium seoulense TaxID=386911 RepID=UPI003CE7274C